MLLITTFVELRVVSGRSRTREGRPHAVTGWPMIIHTCHAMPCRAMPWSLERHGHGMARARCGMCETNTAALCKSNRKYTIYTLSGTAWQWNGMGATWERHGMCELAFNTAQFPCVVRYVNTQFIPHQEHTALKLLNTDQVILHRKTYLL
jgi:hypothetical protein